MTFEDKQMTLWYIRGHNRRVEMLKQERNRILSESRNNTEKQALALTALSDTPTGRDVLIVETALDMVCMDLRGDIRGMLQHGIMLNISGKREFPYERLYLPGISRNEFYRRRGRFIQMVFEKYRAPSND